MLNFELVLQGKRVSYVLALDSSRPFFCSLRLKAFKAALLEVFKASHAQSVGLKALMKSINQDNPEPFSSTEVKVALGRMQDDNQIMLSDDIVFLI